MSGRVRSVSSHEVELLRAGWELCGTAAGAITGPDQLERASAAWHSASVPSTVASSLRAVGAWTVDDPPRRFDAEDWWYRGRFTTAPASAGEELWLCFDGMATVSDVWLNGDLLLSSESMFVAHERRVDTLVRAENELVIRFRSLDALLAERRPRPRWRARMVENQALRWHRTTLLGRTPGWSPPAAPVGPWRDIRLERRRGVCVSDVRIDAHGDGRLAVACRVTPLGAASLQHVELLVERDGRTYRANLTQSSASEILSTDMHVPDVVQWWPHTHGDPALYSMRVRVAHSGGVAEADLGNVGFRNANVVTTDDDFAVHVNGSAIFCRGACWTPLDAFGLSTEPAPLGQAFSQLVDAGMNMARVCGPLVYESDAFLDACDANGVMLWQDFMFANLDYPETTEFARQVDDEVSQLLARVQGRPSLTVLCGNSEVEQQAAMWTAPRELWRPALFHDRIAGLAREACPGVQYWPSSAHGGAFPHQPSAGSSSYYGVGAYRRPLDDARRSDVRFASECLGFANIPASAAAAGITSAPAAGASATALSTRTPRDIGADWDFADVRDHYMALLYRQDPAQLRERDAARYAALGAAATGEVMATVFAEWRRKRSATRGGLVWFLRDLWPCAGWGVVDSTGIPKAAWHYLRRAMAPIALSLSDEGVNGVAVHLENDRPAALAADVEIAMYRPDGLRIEQGARPVLVAGQSAIELNVGEFFGSFLDVSYAYRFGPPAHDLVVATLRNEHGSQLAQAFHFVSGLPGTQDAGIGLRATLRAGTDGDYDLTIATTLFAQSVRIDADGFSSGDNYFHIAPGGERHVRLRRNDPLRSDAGVTPPRVEVRALNGTAPADVSVVVAPR